MTVSIHLAIDCLPNVRVADRVDAESAFRDALDLFDDNSRVQVCRLEPLQDHEPLEEGERVVIMLDPSPFSCQTFEELISQKEILTAQLDRVQDALAEVE